MFPSIDRVTAEIRERFQQLQNLAQKYVFLRLKEILSMDELNLDQAPQDVNKEFKLELVYLQAFVSATDPDCKKELIRSGSLGWPREAENFWLAPGGESTRYANVPAESSLRTQSPNAGLLSRISGERGAGLPPLTF
ncbi:uncharacterized protein TNCV_2988681 [Trichonephila clavipes]|nr:uncharacterized protein TNCV_2988681 [Trichonephila clavipes]